MKTITFVLDKDVKTSDIRIIRAINKLSKFGTIGVLQRRNWYLHISKTNCIKNSFRLQINLPAHDIQERIIIHIIHASSTRMHDVQDNDNSVFSISTLKIERLEKFITKQIVDVMSLPTQVTEFKVGKTVENIDIDWQNILFERSSNLCELPNIREYAPVMSTTEVDISIKFNVE